MPPRCHRRHLRPLQSDCATKRRCETGFPITPEPRAGTNSRIRRSDCGLHVAFSDRSDVPVPWPAWHPARAPDWVACPIGEWRALPDVRQPCPRDVLELGRRERRRATGWRSAPGYGHPHLEGQTKGSIDDRCAQIQRDGENAEFIESLDYYTPTSPSVRPRRGTDTAGKVCLSADERRVLDGPPVNRTRVRGTVARRLGCRGPRGFRGMVRAPSTRHRVSASAPHSR